MQIAIKHRDFIVIDDLVEDAPFRLLYESLKRAKYRPYTEWSSPWSLSEVSAFRGTPFSSDNIAKNFDNPANVAYGIFVKALRAALGDIEYLTGVEGDAWSHFNGNTTLFPPHGALNWHSDKKYVASFSYYCQADWQPRWGGELLVKDEAVSAWGDNAGHNIAEDSPGRAADVGHFVAPIANRIAVIRGATAHRIAAVSPAAGENHRMSITGFFVAGKPQDQSDET